MVASKVWKTSVLLKAVSASLLVLTLAACNGDARPLTEAVEASDIDLSTIQIQPPANSLSPLFASPGNRLQFGILGRTFAGSSVTVSPDNRRWTSTNSNVATVNRNGLVEARNNGTTSISVRVAGAVSQSFVVEVSDALLQGIDRIEGNNSGSLSSCLPENFSAIGSFGGSDLRALTNVLWSIDNESQVAGAQIFTNSGTPAGAISLVGRQATGGAVGDIVLTASVPADENTGQAAFSLTRRFQVSNTLIPPLTVTPNPVTIQVSNSARLVATARFSDRPGSTLVTNGAEWIVALGSEAVSVGTAGSNPGVISGLTDGTATVRAVCGDASGDVIVTIDDNSGSLSFNRNGEQRLDLADRTFDELRVSTGTTFDASDNREVTNDAQWSSSNTQVVTVDTEGSDRGTLTLLSEGQATISAEFRGTVITIEVRVENLSDVQ